MNFTRTLHGALRAAAMLLHMFFGVALALLLVARFGFKWHITITGRRITRWWMDVLADIIGLRIMTDAEPVDEPAMLVANHVSWLDVVAIAAVAPTHFVAKDNVRRWPLIGLLASITGTTFIRRQSAVALKATQAHIEQLLEQGQRVAVFPEGTTTCGHEVLRFHPGLLQAAIRGNYRIQPVVIRYVRDGELDRLAPYIDDDTFVPHLWRILSQPETVVRLRFLPALPSAAASRRQLANILWQAIHDTLQTTVNAPADKTALAEPAQDSTPVPPQSAIAQHL